MYKKQKSGSVHCSKIASHHLIAIFPYFFLNDLAFYFVSAKPTMGKIISSLDVIYKSVMSNNNVWGCGGEAFPRESLACDKANIFTILASVSYKLMKNCLLSLSCVVRLIFPNFSFLRNMGK